MKRFALLLISVLLLALAACGFNAACAEEEAYMTVDASSGIIQCGGFPSRLATRADWSDAAEQALVDGLDSATESIDMSSYKLTAEVFQEMFTSVLNDHYEFFYVTGAYSYSYNGSGYIVSVMPSYCEYDEELSVVRQEMKTALNRAVSYAKTASSKVFQALKANDYLCAHMTYDTTLSHYDAYSALVGGCAVCRATMKPTA